jgi:hypothetical protein
MTEGRINKNNAPKAPFELFAKISLKFVFSKPHSAYPSGGVFSELNRIPF